MKGYKTLATSIPPENLSHEILPSTEIKKIIEKVLDASKAEDIEVIDLRGQSSIADYMIIASGQSSRQIVGFAGKIQDELLEHGMKVRSEGASQGDWVVLDAIDVIVHLFRPEVREFYAIEKMWRNEPDRPVAALQ